MLEHQEAEEHQEARERQEAREDQDNEEDQEVVGVVADHRAHHRAWE